MIKCIKKCALVFTIIISTLLCGCHGSKQAKEFVMPSEFDTEKDVVISFWAKNDTNKAQTDIYQKAIDDFTKIYPNVSVNMKLYTDYSKIYNDVITNISTGTTPNVCITYPDHIATYVSGQNLVVDLNSVIDDEKYGLGGSKVQFDAPRKDEIVEEYLMEGVIGGHQYAMPFMRSTEACYINKTYVEKLGYTIPDELTWDFIWEVSDKACEKNTDGTYKINGQNVMIPFIYKSTDNMMIQYLAQKNAPYSDNEGNVFLFNDETRDFLKTIASHVKKGAFSTFKISSYPANFLNAGQCIFAIDSTAGSTWMGADAPLCDIDPSTKVDFETVVKRVPQVDNSNPRIISQGPSVCVFNKSDEQEVLASWLFVQYLLTNDIQIGYSSTEGYIPVTKKALDSLEYKEYLSKSGIDNNEHYYVKMDSIKMLNDNINNTFTTPVFNGSASLRQASGEVIENTVKTIRRNGTFDDAYLDDMFENVASLYHLDEISGNVNGISKNDLGKLPNESKALIITLVVVWIFIVTYVGLKAFKKSLDHRIL